jgi:predicted nucleic acid-binding protein
MLIALDTNILGYAGGLNDSERKVTAITLLSRLSPERVFIPVQALGELFYVLVRRAAVKGTEAKSVVLRWCDQYSLIETSPAVLLAAMELSSEPHLRIWDAVMIAAAASAGCRLLLSEDLQDGFTWSGVTVVNPFSKTPHELLAEALES